MSAVAAGLPNITGQFQGGDQNYTYANGAFSNEGNTKSTISGSTTNLNKVSFDASRSSSIYGASTTVQPPAIQLIPQIKF